MRFAPRWKHYLAIAAIVCGALSACGCRQSASSSNSSAASSSNSNPADGGVAPDALLDSAVQLLQSSQRSPIAHQVAAQRLNQYLLKSAASGQPLLEPLSAEVETTLASGLTPEQFQQLKSEQFDRPDSLHLEACFLRRDVVKHVTAGIRDDLGKIQALFDWVIRNIQIVGTDEAPPVPLTTGVTLILGRGTAEERAWTFMELLRQIEIESVMLAHVKRDLKENKFVFTPLLPAVWLDDSLYLFDTTLGLPVPGPNGEGVATLSQVQANPELLFQLDLDVERPYRIRPDHLNTIVLLLESTPDYWSPRMRFLQERLSGDNRAVLWSDFSKVYARFRQATSEKTEFELWPLPKTVERVARTQEYRDRLVGGREQIIGLLTPYQFFPGSDARAAHLHGHWRDAIPIYLENRVSFPEWTSQERNRIGFRTLAANASKKDRTPDEMGQELAAKVPELYNLIREDSTYFLGVAKFEQREYEPAANWMGKSYLEKYPEGRWRASALYHLGRCAEAQQNFEKAIEYYTQDRTSPQAHGNLIRARRLGWKPDAAASVSDDAPAVSEKPGKGSP